MLTFEEVKQLMIELNEAFMKALSPLLNALGDDLHAELLRIIINTTREELSSASSFEELEQALESNVTLAKLLTPTNKGVNDA